jgi:hypothetical protein
MFSTYTYGRIRQYSKSSWRMMGKKVLELSASPGKGRKMNYRFGEFDIVALGEKAALML